MYYKIDHYDLKHPVKPTAKMKKNYPVALQRYPSLEDCRQAGFAPENHTLTNPPRIFWTAGEFSVCYYWYLHSVDNLKGELEKLADEIGSTALTRPSHTSVRDQERSVIGPRISITWRFKNHDTPYGWNFVHRWIINTFSRAAGFRVTLHKKHKIDFVRFSIAVI